MGTAGRQVDIQRRTDEVLYFLKDKVAYNIAYYGRTEGFESETDEPVWQIKRVTLDALGLETTTFANHGKYNCVWDDRVGYFDAEPAPIDDPGVVITGEITPHGLTIAGRITEVALDSTTWTPLPAVALTDRNAFSLQNRSGIEIKLQFNPLTVGYVGITVPDGYERAYDITDQIIIYAKAAMGTPTITVEELA